MNSFSEIDGLVTLDEVGIACAPLAGHVLRTAFRLAYGREGDRMRPVLARGLLRVFHGGRSIRPGVFLRELSDADREMARASALALHIRNAPNLDLDDADHLIDLTGVGLDLALEAPELALIVARLMSAADMPAERAVALFTIAEGTDERLLHDHAEAMRTLGLRLAIGGSAGGEPPLGAIRVLRPDMAVLDGRWLSPLVASREASRLLGDLVARLRGEGARVGVSGVHDARMLAAALDAGADWLEGDVFPEPVLAGSVIDAPALELAGLAGERAQVVPLRRA